MYPQALPQPEPEPEPEQEPEQQPRGSAPAGGRRKAPPLWSHHVTSSQRTHSAHAFRAVAALQLDQQPQQERSQEVAAESRRPVEPLQLDMLPPTRRGGVPPPSSGPEIMQPRASTQPRRKPPPLRALVATTRSSAGRLGSTRPVATRAAPALTAPIPSPRLRLPAQEHMRAGNGGVRQLQLQTGQRLPQLGAAAGSQRSLARPPTQATFSEEPSSSSGPSDLDQSMSILDWLQGYTRFRTDKVRGVDMQYWVEEITRALEQDSIYALADLVSYSRTDSKLQRLAFSSPANGSKQRAWLREVLATTLKRNGAAASPRGGGSRSASPDKFTENEGASFGRSSSAAASLPGPAMNGSGSGSGSGEAAGADADAVGADAFERREYQAGDVIMQQGE